MRRTLSRTLTSASHPLRIDEVGTPGGGRIGLSFCPGKHQSAGASGTWARNLAADLEAIREWGAVALVCLVEHHELDQLRVPELPAATRAHGIEFHHLPIADFHAPDDLFEDLWLYHGTRLRRLLGDGGRVFIHCKGGLGRTGTVAARLLAEFGQPAVEATRTVRAARPGAIENATQERHVLATRPVDDTHERVVGCLLGGAVGDGFGYAVEFDRLAAIRVRFGADGLREPVLRSGRLVVSDDTQMTLFTLEGLAAALRDDPTADVEAVVTRVRRAYLDWLVTQDASVASLYPPSGGRLVEEPLLHAARAPGSTCLSALRAGGDGSERRPINQSKGCGGVMRVAPLGFVPARYDTGACARLGLRAAALTHGHPSGYHAAALMSACVRELVAGIDLPAALDVAAAAIAGHRDTRETLEAVAHARSLAASAQADHTAAMARLGEGWVAEEALAIGVYAALVGADFPEVLAIAANHDGDSDSTASIAGQLYGAWRGVATLPHAWVTSLDVLVPALRTLGMLHAATR